MVREDGGDTPQDKTAAAGSSLESDLKLELVKQLKNQSRFALILTFAGAVAVLGSLWWSSAQIRSAEAKLKQIELEEQQHKENITTLKGQEETLKKQVDENQRDYAKVTNGLLLKLGSGASAALQQATAANPDAAKSIPIIYLDVANEDQRPAASKIAIGLRAAGFVVPKTGSPPKGTNFPNVTELRYWEDTPQSAQDCALILENLSSMGVDAKKVIPDWKGSKEPPPRQYEIWFSPSQFNQPTTVASKH
jgi:cell division protein FtsB